MGGVCGGMDKEVRGLRIKNRSLENSDGDVKNSTGNGVAKGVIHMTHGQWDARESGDCQVERVKGEKTGTAVTV